MEPNAKNILVVGLGVSGLAAAELLLDKGFRVRVTESGENEAITGRAELLRARGAGVETGGHTAAFCAGPDLVVVSPGVPRDILPLSIAAEKKVPVIGEMELGYRYCQAPIIAVTGTNGKTTTTELIGSIMARAGRNTIVCGNIGNPLCGEIHNIKPGSIVVAEVSSFQLETIVEFRPFISVLLNVTDDHYDRHAGIEDYKKQKFRIFENQRCGDHAILHQSLMRDRLVGGILAEKHFYGSGDGMPSGVRGRMLSIDDGAGRKLEIPADDVPLRGAHNLENAVCSALAGMLAGADGKSVKEAIRDFTPLSHRFEKFHEFRGVEYIDDSKATNVDAAKRALESADRKVVLVAGGIDKGGDYGCMLDIVREKVKAIVVIGEAKDIITKAFSGCVPVHQEQDMRGAVRKASSLAEAGEAVMLSPMCSSFDMFSGYKERGEVFQREVKALGAKQ